MTLTKYERNNTIKVSVTFQSNGVDTDPSGGTADTAKAFINVIKPDNTYLVGNELSGATASRTATGKFDYYFETASTDPLGIYRIVWTAYHDIGTVDNVDYGYMKINQADAIQIVDVEQ